LAGLDWFVTTGLPLQRETAFEKTNPRDFADAGIFTGLLCLGEKSKQADKASIYEGT